MLKFVCIGIGLLISPTPHTQKSDFPHRSFKHLASIIWGKAFSYNIGPNCKPTNYCVDYVLWTSGAIQGIFDDFWLLPHKLSLESNPCIRWDSCPCKFVARGFGTLSSQSWLRSTIQDKNCKYCSVNNDKYAMSNCHYLHIYWPPTLCQV